MMMMIWDKMFQNTFADIPKSLKMFCEKKKSEQTHNSCPDLPAWKRLSSWLLTDDCSFSCLLSQKVSPQRAGNLFGHRVQPAPLTPVITSLLSLRDRLDFNLFKMVQRAIIWALIRLPSTFQSTQAIKFPSGSVLNIANLHFMSDIERNQIFSTLQKIVRFFLEGWAFTCEWKVKSIH